MTRTLSIGMHGHDVATFQVSLNAVGEPVSADGVFNHATAQATRRLQQQLGKPIDGRADPLLQAEAARLAAGAIQAATRREPALSADWRGLSVIMPLFTPHGLRGRLDILADSIKGLRWSLSVAGEAPAVNEAAAWAASNGVEFSGVAERSDNVNYLRNCALLAAKPKFFDFPTVWICDGHPTAGLKTFVKTALSSPAMAMAGPYAASAQTFIPDRTSQVDGRWPAAAVVFHSRLVPPDGQLFDSSFSTPADSLVWLKWKLEGISFELAGQDPITKLDRLPALTGELTAARRKLADKSARRPKVSALMLTGKCVERYPLARVAVECFDRQTWPNKELIIVNHGTVQLSDGRDPRVREFMIKREPGMTLGDIRNISIEAADGDWCVQWDDDDWHHPTRIETQMAMAEEDALCTFLWQVRCNLYDGTAFYDRFPGGQHMSILFSRSIRHRYPKLEIREDTAFKEKFRRTNVIDNGVDNVAADPFQYVRFYHGRNIWDADHIMRGSLVNYPAEPGQVNLVDWHATLMSEIMDDYRRQPGFALPESPLLVPDVPDGVVVTPD